VADATATPIISHPSLVTFSLSEAFRRREKALSALAQLKASLVALLQGARDWDWPAGGAFKGGRAALPHAFTRDARATLLRLTEQQAAFLLAPISSRTRHALSASGQAERAAAARTSRALDGDIASHFDDISAFVEVMKASGLPGNEASRLRAFAAVAASEWEALRALKRYRTPQTIRAFARIYTLLHPGFMAPYYAHVAGTVSDNAGVSLAFALGLGCATSLCLSALFSTRYRLEDPFASGEADAVDVRAEFEHLGRALRAGGGGGGGGGARAEEEETRVARAGAR
jgi:hypothetical protein